MEWAKLKWTKNTKEHWNEMALHSATAQHTFYNVAPAIGVDPGKNFGLAILSPYPNDKLGGMMLTTWWGSFPSQEHDYDYFDIVMNFVEDWFPKVHPSKVAIIEGAAYGTHFKREYLEDIRLGFLQAFKALGKEVSYISPLSARKQVFGSGKIKASELFLQINKNGADASCIALCAAGYEYAIDK